MVLAPPVGMESLSAGSSVDLREEARRAARRYGLDPVIFERQIDQESGFNPQARSPAGARGIAQFMPETARAFNLDPNDPIASLDAGARYVAQNRDLLGGDTRAALAAYNAGPGAVQDLQRQYGADWEAHLPEETRVYLARILGGGNDALASHLSTGQTSFGPSRIRPPSAGDGGFLPLTLQPTDTSQAPVDNLLSRLRVRPTEDMTPEERIQQAVDTAGHPLADGNYGDVPYDAGQGAYEAPYVDAPANTLRARLEAQRQGESQYGTLTEPDRLATAAEVAVQGAFNATPGLAAANIASGAIAGALNQAGAPQSAQTIASLAPFTAGGKGNLLSKVARTAGAGIGMLGGEKLDEALGVDGLPVIGGPFQTAGMIAGDVLGGVATRPNVGANIVPKSNKQTQDLMAQTIAKAQQAYDDAIANGASPAEARKARMQAMQEMQAEGTALQAEKQLDERAQGYDRYGSAEGKTLRTRAQQMSDRMGLTEEPVGREAPLNPWESPSSVQAGAETLAGITPTERPSQPLRGDQASIPVGAAAAVNGKQKPGDMFTDAAREEKRYQDAAERNAVAEHQARVEAADFQRRRDEWIDNLRKEVEADAAPGTIPAGADVLTYAQRLRQARAEARASKGGGIGAEVAGVLGAPRALALSADAGTLRDLTILGSSRKGFQPAVKGGTAGLQAFFDADAAQAAQQSVKDNDWYNFVTSKTNFERPFHVYEYGEGAAADARVPEMSGLNQSKVSKVVGKLPHVEMSDRALAVQRNVAGMELLAGRAEELAQIYGKDSPRFFKEMQSTIDWVNHTRGYSGGEMAKKLGGIGVFTSPQQLLSRLQLVGDPISFALRGDRQAAQFAAENLLTFAGTQIAFLKLMAMAQGGAVQVNTNPLEGDFGTVQVSNQRYDTLAGFGPTVRLLARITAAGSDQVLGTDYAKNQQDVGLLVERWLENKANPIARIVAQRVLHGQNPDAKTLAGLVAPSLATGLLDSVQAEQGNNRLLAGATAGLSFLGGGTSSYATADDRKRELASSLYNGRSYEDLSGPERLKVVDQLPEDVARAGKTDARREFDDALTKAGYVSKAPENETPEQKTARQQKNAQIIHDNPDLDVQDWYYGDKNGGSLATIDAVDSALKLGLDKSREVKLAGASRVLNADEGSKKAWDKYGNIVDWYLHEIASDKDNLEAKTQALFKNDAQLRGKTYDQLPKEKQSDVRQSLHEQAKKDPTTAALLIFFGVDKPDADGIYHIQSKATAAALQKLWEEFPDAQPLAKKEYSATLAKDAK